MILRKTPTRRLWFLITHLLALAILGPAAGCSDDEPLLHATNAVPIIEALTASPDTVSMGQVSNLACVATDGDSDLLSYVWSADIGTFLGTIHDRATIRWQAPAAEGVATITVTATDDEDSATRAVEILVLGEPGSLEGLVTAQSDGSPLEGVTVSLDSFSAVTGASGAYRIESIPEGSYTVTAALAGYVTGRTPFEVKSGENDLNFVLSAVGEVGRISGTVTNALGNPVAGVACSIASLDLSTETDASGNYAFETVANGSYNVTFLAAGYALLSRGATVDSGDLDLDVVLNAQIIDPPADLLAGRDSGTTITVTWTPSSLATLKGQRLWVRREDETSVPAHTGFLSPTQSMFVYEGDLHTRYRFRIQTVNIEDEESPNLNLSNTVVLTPPSSLVAIPAGSVVMADTPPASAGDPWSNTTHPGNPVAVEAFSIEATEVSNRQFRAALIEMLSTGQIQTDAAGVWQGNNQILNTSASKIKWNQATSAFTLESGLEERPVVGVTWFGATLYAQHVGRRLPTEAEWERAARGDAADSGTYGSTGVGYGTKYPWGNSPASAERANYGNVLGRAVEVTALSLGATTRWEAPIYNLAGNVWEWCADWFGAYASPHAPPDTGTLRVARGGSWFDQASYLRVGARFSATPGAGTPALGFRCAND